MLRAVTAALHGRGPQRLDDVARRAGVAPSALGPMLELFAHRGLLAPAGGTCAGSCGPACRPDDCPLVVRLPTTIEAQLLDRAASPIHLPIRFSAPAPPKRTAAGGMCDSDLPTTGVPRF